MSKNTINPALTPKPRKRAKRHTETAQFDAFVRRILRAYARRVADGDIEALRMLAGLSAEVDAVTRAAVAGLRTKPYSYSWSQIADRLGVSPQGAQQRFGKPSDRNALDRRLLESGLGVTLATLVQVFADHHPGNPPASRCPGCGYRYPDGVSDCPTNATVRPLLYKRRDENRAEVARLSADAFTDLHEPVKARFRAAVRQAANPTPSPDLPRPTLFDLPGRTRRDDNH
ncbi:hypothetical protein [Paractinoplanes rishiriensis]|uniref:Uncharacterized protein n=1 Tax=Paractinoplanes rishiriensis TaxID=1050105 RepID=A0A919JQM1_9ACTN|nr:hypothetical protein [Actinoplanes rishiriensis]GIE93316.1 hypothetical protein Ari01nite_07810 [Actinoplanes rishiriensis]